MRLNRLPRLYAILDGGTVRAAGLDLLDTAKAMRDAGLTLLQYRDKGEGEAAILKNARSIARLFEGSGAMLLLNDWPEIAIEAEWDGVHVGQMDAAVAVARRIVGPNRIVGVSTHNPVQFLAAAATDANYLAFGPIFGSSTKLDAEPAVGLEGLREIRRLTTRPIVAIGGVSEERMPAVYAAGADSIALIGALFQQGESVLESASRLLRCAGLDR